MNSSPPKRAIMSSSRRTFCCQLGKGNQHVVGDGRAIGVVDLLEMIQVYQRDYRVYPGGAKQVDARCASRGEKNRSVDKAGQAVVVGQVSATGPIMPLRRFLMQLQVGCAALQALAQLPNVVQKESSASPENRRVRTFEQMPLVSVEYWLLPQRVEYESEPRPIPTPNASARHGKERRGRDNWKNTEPAG